MNQHQGFIESECRIKQLPAAVAKAIAAGEVIERPTSAVKELVENAIDAEATRIEVALEGGGLRKIVVKDNGWGMTQEDLLLCTQPHATSKLTSIDDMRTLMTLGFRGEALSSIATFGDLTIISCAVGKLTGYKRVLRGEEQSLEEIGASAGTTVVVENLFARFPARLKHSVSERVERKMLLQTLQMIAMNYPYLYLSFSFNGKQIYQSVPLSPLSAHLTSLFGIAEKHFLALEQDTPFKVRGMISDPPLHFSKADHLYFSVNGHWVRSPLLIRALKQAYRNFIPEKHYPAAVLLIWMPPEKLDLNIHPRKTEIAFLDKSETIAVLTSCLKQTLHKHKIVQVKGDTVQVDKEASHSHIAEAVVAYGEVKVHQESWMDQGHHRYLGQLLQTFLLVEDEAGLLLIDQHALHERYLLEEWKKKRVLPYAQAQLLFPITLSLSRSVILFLEEHCQLLEDIGFELSCLGPTSLALRSVPQVKGLIKEDILKMLLTELAEEGKAHPFSLEEDAIKMLSCRHAVRAGDTLAPEEVKQWLDGFGDLIQLTPSLFSCAHGRPTIVRLSRSEIERLFQRR